MSRSIYTAADRARVLARLRAGDSVASVAARTGIAQATIYVWAKRERLEIARRPREIPSWGCGHFAMGCRRICTSCRIDVAQGRAVVREAAAAKGDDGR